LGYHGFHRKFLYNENKKRGSDLLLIDESSMVSLPLFRRLLLALKEGCRVILLGDKDQLTAVETGNVLGELTQAKKINTFSREFCQEYRVLTGEVFDFNNQDHSLLHDRVLKLEHSYRFNENQGVGKLSALINRCDSRTEFDEFNDLFSNFADISLHPLTKKFSVSKELSPDFFKKYTGLLQKIPDLKSHEDAKVILECLKEFRVLCASRVGRFGVEKLNQMLSKDIFGKEDKSLYHGRCVMILQNNRHLEVYNGDVGVVLWKSGIPHVYFEGGKGEVREFNPTILPQFETAFAMTVHKSQGSEYDQICLLLQEEGRQHVQKELIYTGVTRAKSKVKIFSQKESFLEMCRRKTIRYSGIAQKLRLN
jgi:exodeoxyribonuclease V alpha subunit